MRVKMVSRLICTLVLAGTVAHVGNLLATPASGFSGSTIAVGRFEPIDVSNLALPRDLSSLTMKTPWLSLQKTHGASDLYVQSNLWLPGGTTGWHTHPGHSLIIVTEGTVTVYDGDDHSCEPGQHTFWRPETAARNGDADGNPKTEANSDFTPFITTPCHPSYPWAHASISYAARRVVHGLWGNGGHSIALTVPSLPQMMLHYSSLKQITDDIDNARVYGEFTSASTRRPAPARGGGLVGTSMGTSYDLRSLTVQRSSFANLCAEKVPPAGDNAAPC